MQRADSLEKALMLGKIEGRRRRGRQRMRWLGGIIDKLHMLILSSSLPVSAINYVPKPLHLLYECLQCLRELATGTHTGCCHGLWGAWQVPACLWMHGAQPVSCPAFTQPVSPLHSLILTPEPTAGPPRSLAVPHCSRLQRGPSIRVGHCPCSAFSVLFHRLCYSSSQLLSWRYRTHFRPTTGFAHLGLHMACPA